MSNLTNVRHNIRFFKITSVLQWFYIPIGVWVLIWRSHFSWTEIATISSISLLVQLLLELPSGALADLWGRKNTVLFGRALGVVGFIFMTFGSTFLAVLIGNILYLANWAFESGALDALLYDSMKENGVGEVEYQKVQADTFFTVRLGWPSVVLLVVISIRLTLNSPMALLPSSPLALS